MESSTTPSPDFEQKILKFSAFLVIVSGIILFPPIFRLFSVGELLKVESSVLKIASLLLIAIGIFLFIIKRKLPVNTGLVILSLWVLFFIEILFRLVANVIASDELKVTLNNLGNATHRESAAYTGSPFMHFSGKPSVQLKGSKYLAGRSPFNNYGFVGNDFYRYKPSDVIRIACLGESTTADGYPGFLESYLNNNCSDCRYRFEVYNFGHAYYNSAHSVANLAFNVIDFDPDIIVVHHGWNEERIRNVHDSVFRYDYSHVYKPFEHPYLFDRYIIRCSAMYRYFKYKYSKDHSWVSLAGSIQKEVPRTDNDFNDLYQLLPFERNMNTIVDFSQVQQRTVFLVTLPRTTDSSSYLYYAYKNIDQCNNITRGIHKENLTNTILVDLDSVISGKRNDIFIDLAHINDDGRTLKSSIIGDSIISYLRRNSDEFKPRFNQRIRQEDGVEYYKNEILNNQNWLQDVQKKAADRQIPEDSMIYLDALYMVETELERIR